MKLKDLFENTEQQNSTEDDSFSGELVLISLFGTDPDFKGEGFLHNFPMSKFKQLSMGNTDTIEQRRRLIQLGQLHELFLSVGGKKERQQLAAFFFGLLQHRLRMVDVLKYFEWVYDDSNKVYYPIRGSMDTSVKIDSHPLYDHVIFGLFRYAAALDIADEMLFYSEEQWEKVGVVLRPSVKNLLDAVKDLPTPTTKLIPENSEARKLLDYLYLSLKQVLRGRITRIIESTLAA